MPHVQAYFAITAWRFVPNFDDLYTSFRLGLFSIHFLSTFSENILNLA